MSLFFNAPLAFIARGVGIVLRLLPNVQGSTSGYSSGGILSPPFTRLDTIDKFPFASDGNATDVGDLTVARSHPAGQSSTASGYSSGGFDPAPAATNVIDKFPFASDGNATDVGDLTVVRNTLAGQSSTVSGYSSGGNNPGLSPAYIDVIDKFPFASDGNATDVGDLTLGRSNVTGQSSTASGYTSGGFFGPPFARFDTIDKFPFASDGNASDVGDLTTVRTNAAGQQV